MVVTEKCIETNFNTLFFMGKTWIGFLVCNVDKMEM